MRSLGCIIGVFVAILATSVAAMAALRITVTPLEGTPRTKFTVSFVVDRELSNGRWLVVKVVSPVTQSDCEYQESDTVSYAPKGRRVNVVLRPWDRHRWCPGAYSGTVRVARRVSCSSDGPNTGPCWTDGALLARFSFSVTL
jgi:hypothetical protein